MRTDSYNTTIYSRLLAEMYRVMLSDKKYGLTVAVLATRVLPVLLPQLVNPQLDLEMEERWQHTDRRSSASWQEGRGAAGQRSALLARRVGAGTVLRRIT